MILDTLMDYDEVINIETVTRLPDYDFNNQFEVIPFQKPTLN